jgi:hypothetical protein
MVFNGGRPPSSMRPGKRTIIEISRITVIRRQHPIPHVPVFRIGENFNVVEHILSSIDPCLVGASPSSFLREEIEEALRDGIVVAVPAFKLKQALGIDFEGG